MITDTAWTSRREYILPIREEDLLVVTPYRTHVVIMRRHGPWLVRADHDGTDEKGDIEALKMLCLYRYNSGESNDT
jgi:hypothetical protein